MREELKFVLVQLVLCQKYAVLFKRLWTKFLKVSGKKQSFTCWKCVLLNRNVYRLYKRMMALPTYHTHTVAPFSECQ